MFDADLDVAVGDERHKELLRDAEQWRRFRSSRIRRRSKLRLWVGNQLIFMEG